VLLQRIAIFWGLKSSAKIGDEQGLTLSSSVFRDHSLSCVTKTGTAYTALAKDLCCNKLLHAIEKSYQVELATGQNTANFTELNKVH
jgi:hypothetical protein